MANSDSPIPASLYWHPVLVQINSLPLPTNSFCLSSQLKFLCIYVEGLQENGHAWVRSLSNYLLETNSETKLDLKGKCSPKRLIKSYSSIFLSEVQRQKLWWGLKREATSETGHPSKLKPSEKRSHPSVIYREQNFKSWPVFRIIGCMDQAGLNHHLGYDAFENHPGEGSRTSQPTLENMYIRVPVIWPLHV